MHNDNEGDCVMKNHNDNNDNGNNNDNKHVVCHWYLQNALLHYNSTFGKETHNASQFACMRGRNNQLSCLTFRYLWNKWTLKYQSSLIRCITLYLIKDLKTFARMCVFNVTGKAVWVAVKIL